MAENSRPSTRGTPLITFACGAREQVAFDVDRAEFARSSEGR